MTKTMDDVLAERKNQLRQLIPKNRNGNPATPRLQRLDSMLAASSFSIAELEFVEREIESWAKRPRKETEDCDE